MQLTGGIRLLDKLKRVITNPVYFIYLIVIFIVVAFLIGAYALNKS